MKYLFRFSDHSTRTLEGNLPFEALRATGYTIGTFNGESYARHKYSEAWLKFTWEPAPITAGKVGE